MTGDRNNLFFPVTRRGLPFTALQFFLSPLPSFFLSSFLAALAVFAGAGGLGSEILTDRYFKSNVVVAGGLAVLLAAVLDLLILGVQRAITPWQRARA